MAVTTERETARAAICDAVDQVAPDLIALSERIHAHPEVGFGEHQATTWLTEALERFGSQVERGVAGMDTAFLGWLRGAADHPCIGLVAEYDALPNLGHGCGHNLIGTAAVGAIAGLRALAAGLPGAVVVMGSPAEEGGGGKQLLLERGALDAVDLALGVHPRGGKNFVATEPGTGSSLARAVLSFEFHGKAAHAAVNPFDGINALDAMILLYNGIGTLRQHLRADARIHGIITHGGDAPNIIPAYTAARFYARARDSAYLAEVVEKLRNVAQGAALQTGARVEISHPEPTYESTRPNLTLGRVFRRNMKALGLDVESVDPQGGTSSTDFGNISQVKPAISAKFSISATRIPGHSILFREAAASEVGRQALLNMAKSYALTTYDLLTQPELVAEAQREFAATQAQP